MRWLGRTWLRRAWLRAGLLGAALGAAACGGDARQGQGGAPDGGLPGARDASAPRDAAVRVDSTVPEAGTGGASGSSSLADASSAPDAALSDAGGLGAYDGGTAAAPSNGGSITFQQIGAPGWYPSRRDPASGECSAIETATCCMTRHEITSDALTPWDEDLIMTLRGPVVVQQLAVYQPAETAGGLWSRVADWDARKANASRALAFDGAATRDAAFAGVVGDQCLVDVASDRAFPCGPGSVPYCPETPPEQPKRYGWSGSKLFVMLLAMPHADDGSIAPALHCGSDAANNWYDAPWIGFSHGELVRSGKFGDCHCYAKDPAEWFNGDGCGQLNAFEVVNDNNAAMNLDVFSTNFFGYQGYIGEGPCGSQCDTTALAANVDLIDKASSGEAAAGAIATPEGGPGAAFVRPSREPRYFIVLFDVGARTVQLAMISPASIPAAAAALLPELPGQLAPSAIDELLGMRLPR
jgi:hypothetical protein